jgi:hypothetical protein
VIILRVERFARVLHQFLHRLNGALGGHHRGGADLEHLHDVRRVPGPERGDPGVHRFGVAALERRRDLVVLLGGVELFGELHDHLVVRPGHRVPPLDFGLRGRRRRARYENRRSRAALCPTLEIRSHARLR